MTKDDELLFESLNEFSKLDTDEDVLRTNLLQATLRCVRLRRRRRITIQGMLIGAVFAAGVLAGRFWFAPAAPTLADANRNVAQDEAPRNAVEIQPDVRHITDPMELRQRVIDSSTEQKLLLLARAGDLYLERNELEEAIDCYRQVIELAPETESLGVHPEDSWLLAELKQNSFALTHISNEVDR